MQNIYETGFTKPTTPGQNLQKQANLARAIERRNDLQKKISDANKKISDLRNK